LLRDALITSAVIGNDEVSCDNVVDRGEPCLLRDVLERVPFMFNMCEPIKSLISRERMLQGR
jgi:hypothetical protein